MSKPCRYIFLEFIVVPQAELLIISGIIIFDYFYQTIFFKSYTAVIIYGRSNKQATFNWGMAVLAHDNNELLPMLFVAKIVWTAIMT